VVWTMVVLLGFDVATRGAADRAAVLLGRTLGRFHLVLDALTSAVFGVLIVVFAGAGEDFAGHGSITCWLEGEHWGLGFRRNRSIGRER